MAEIDLYADLCFGASRDAADCHDANEECAAPEETLYRDAPAPSIEKKSFQNAIDLSSIAPSSSTTAVLAFQEREVKELKTSLKRVEDEITRISKERVLEAEQFEALKAERGILVRNISTIYRTAMLELQRKNDEIKKLREQLSSHRSDSLDPSAEKASQRQNPDCRRLPYGKIPTPRPSKQLELQQKPERQVDDPEKENTPPGGRPWLQDKIGKSPRREAEFEDLTRSRGGPWAYRPNGRDRVRGRAEEAREPRDRKSARYDVGERPDAKPGMRGDGRYRHH